MVITAFENFVFFSTLLALAAFAFAGAARKLSLSGTWQVRPDTLARIYASALALPPIFALWLVAATLLPEWWLGKAAFDAAHSTPLHELHLLSDLTTALEPALAYATITFAVAAALFAAWSSLRGYLRVGEVIKRLEMNAAPPPPEHLALVERMAAGHDLDVGLVMSDYPLSFVWGFRRSKLVLSSGLLNALTTEELTGVLEHESAHHVRRDNLFKLALTMCGYCSMAFSLSRLILRWRAAEVELICDEVAVARTSTPLEIAEALLKLRRQTLLPGGYVTTAATFSSSFAPDDALSFERRVYRLITFADAMPDPAQAAQSSQTGNGAAFVVATVLTSTLLGLSLFAPLAVHHGAEAIIQVIK